MASVHGKCGNLRELLLTCLLLLDAIEVTHSERKQRNRISKLYDTTNSSKVKLDVSVSVCVRHKYSP